MLYRNRVSTDYVVWDTCRSHSLIFNSSRWYSVTKTDQAAKVKAEGVIVDSSFLDCSKQMQDRGVGAQMTRNRCGLFAGLVWHN